MNIENFMSSCSLCPRKCGVNRTKGELGYCKTDDKLLVSRASLHFWEEPCISGDKGSGTVFFSGCNLGCVYCQNYKISKAQTGKKITVNRLSEIFIELQKQGALNINLVTPTHFVHQIISALKLSKSNGLNIPIVYNTSGYENIETIKMLNGLVDIYLTDFKYFFSDIAKKYSRAEDYAQIAKAALEEMVNQIGEVIFDDNKIMKKGVIVRHLLLPGYTKDSKQIIEYLYKTYKNKIYISIMNQFTPLETINSFPELNRKITTKEYDKIIDFAISIGVENGFIQEAETSSESYIPDFDNFGV